jgi:hypothetical protein
VIANVYNNATHWAFALKDKLKDLTQFDDGKPIVTYGSFVYADENGITMDVPLTLTNLISFFDGMLL